MKPQLKHVEEFKKVLADYQLSDEARELAAQTELVVMLAPSSSGRNTIIEKLVKTDKYEFVVSHTTRPIRTKDGQPIEEDGVHYWFRDEEELLQDLKDGKFLEAELIHNQQVSGIAIRELEAATKHHKIAITDVDIEGIDNVVKAKPDAHAIMVLPPSPEEWMSRMQNRSDMSTDEVNNRLRTAEKILESLHDRDYYKIVVSKEVDAATEQVRQIVEQGEYSDESHQAGLDLSWKLLSYVKQQLYS